MAHTELKFKVNKFLIPHNKADSVLFIGDQYLKFHDVNFTNKIMKENSLNIIPMKLEKENNFIDIVYLNKYDMFIIITDSNNIFIYEKNILKHKMLNCL